MPALPADPALRPAGEQVLGYLNFSSGQSDPLFLANLNRLFAAHESQPAATAGGKASAGGKLEPTWRKVWADLAVLLADCRATKATFRNADQAAAVLVLADVFQRVQHRARIEQHRPVVKLTLGAQQLLLKVGQLASARISPVDGSMITALPPAARFSSTPARSSRSAMYWRF